MPKTVELAFEAAFDVSDTVGGFDDIGAAADGMASKVDAATRDVDASAGRMDSVADSADNLGSSSSQAAGGLGDLGGALSAVPGPLGAVGSGMETVAPLVMGVTGATDLMTLAMNSNIVTTVRSRAATISHAVATKTSAAAMKVAAVGQWALNAAMTANPIGIVVVAIAALVAGLVLAYNKSETFRNIVDKAMGVAADAVEPVVNVVKKIPDGIDTAIDGVQKLPGAVGDAKDLVVDYFNLMTTPIQKVIDLVEWLLNKIDDIDFPDVPDLNPFGRASSRSGQGVLGGDLRGGLVVPVNVNGGYVGNEAQLGRVIQEAVARELRRRRIR